MIQYLHENLGFTENNLNEYNLSDLCEHNELDKIKYIHEQIKVTKMHVIDNDAINHACSRGYYYLVKYLYEKIGFTKKEFMQNDNHAYNLARENNHFDIMEYLCNVIKINH